MLLLAATRAALHLRDERLRCSFNLSPEPTPWSAGGRTIAGTGDIGAGELGPYAAVIEEIE